jgi:hypothetical protein
MLARKAGEAYTCHTSPRYEVSRREVESVELSTGRPNQLLTFVVSLDNPIGLLEMLAGLLMELDTKVRAMIERGRRGLYNLSQIACFTIFNKRSALAGEKCSVPIIDGGIMEPLGRVLAEHAIRMAWFVWHLWRRRRRRRLHMESFQDSATRCRIIAENIIHDDSCTGFAL